MDRTVKSKHPECGDLTKVQDHHTGGDGSKEHLEDDVLATSDKRVNLGLKTPGSEKRLICSNAPSPANKKQKVGPETAKGLMKPQVMIYEATKICKASKTCAATRTCEAPKNTMDPKTYEATTAVKTCEATTALKTCEATTALKTCEAVKTPMVPKTCEAAKTSTVPKTCEAAKTSTVLKTCGATTASHCPSKMSDLNLVTLLLE